MATDLMQFTNSEELDFTKLELNGGIYTGELGDGRKVAVKRVPPEMEGVGTVSRILGVPRDKDNILYPIGYMVNEAENYVLIVYDFMPSLDTFLVDGDGRRLDWANRVEIAVGVARGMTSLHESNIKYGSLRPSKIVLTEQLQPKLREAAIVMFDDAIAPYVDPLYLESRKVQNPNDVYSYGQILLELIGPGPDSPGREAMVKLGRDCMGPVRNRPTMRQVLEILENLGREQEEGRKSGDPLELEDQVKGDQNQAPQVEGDQNQAPQVEGDQNQANPQVEGDQINQAPRVEGDQINQAPRVEGDQQNQRQDPPGGEDGCCGECCGELWGNCCEWLLTCCCGGGGPPVPPF